MSSPQSSLRHVQHASFLRVNDLARHTAWLHAPMRLYATYGVVLFAVLLMLSWWLARGRGDLRLVARSLWAPVGVLVAVGLNQPLIHAVGERRPFVALPHVLVLVQHSSDAGFPSDHAVMAGAATAGIVLVDRRLGVFTALAAVLISFARVYVGVHYPLDVVAGLAFGAVVTLVGYVVAGRLLVPLLTGLSRTPLRPLVAAAPLRRASAAVDTPMRALVERNRSTVPVAGTSPPDPG